MKRTNVVDNDYASKRKKLRLSLSRINLLCSSSSVTHIENVSDEILYEIFEFFDFYDVYNIFSNLNKRFQNLIINSKLPTTIDVSSISKTNFQRYYTHNIIPFIHRIKSLRVSNSFTVNIILSSLDNVSKFLRLETLVLDNIEPPFLRNINYLITLPRLYSLVIISNTRVRNQANIYYQIFHLPVLRYCRVSFREDYRPVLLPFATNKYSPIKHLVINGNVHFNLLRCILSYVPRLRRLSIGVLFDSDTKKRNRFSVVLNHLTHISLELNSVIFENFELLVKNLFHNLYALRISTSHDKTYLNADHWQDLILSHMPKLSIFDFQYIYSAHSGKLVTPTHETLINKFNSSFWIERQWFFSIQYPCGLYQDNTIFYSTKPYRRRNFTLYGIIKENNSFNSVDHLHIQSIRAMINCTNYFPNATKLTFSDHFDIMCDSIENKLTHIIPLKQINTLVLEYNFPSFKQLIQLLGFAVNIRTLKLISVTVNQIDAATIQQSDMFQLVSHTNTIKNMILKKECSFDGIELLIALCPRLQHITVNGYANSCKLILRLLHSKNRRDTPLLSTLCASKIDEVSGNHLKKIINLRKLQEGVLENYNNGKLNLWW